MRSPRMLVLLGALLAASATVPAAAQPDAGAQQAKAAYQAGMQLFNAKRYNDALSKFRESYDIAASPNTRLMVVRTLNESGRPVEAYREGVAALKEAQDAAAQAPDKHKAAVDGIQNELAAAKAKIGLLTVTVTGAAPGAKVTVGGRPVAADVLAEPIPLEPGEVEVLLQAAEGNDSEKVTVQAGSEVTVQLAPAAGAKATPPPPPPPRPVPPPKEEGSGYQGPDRLMMAIIAGGVGVLGFIGFGTFGLLSNARFDRLERACDEDSFCDPELEDQADTGRTYQVVANVSLGIGIVGIAAGGGLFLWDFLDPENPEAAAWRLNVGPTGASVHASF